MEPPPFSPDLLKPVNTYQLHKELQKIEGLERLKETEVRTPTFKTKLQVFTALLELNCISTCTDLMSSREQERLKEKRAGKSLEQRRMSEHAFRRIFSKVVSKVIKRMKGEDDSVAAVQQLALELFGKQSTPKLCHRAMNFLLRHGLHKIEQEEQKVDEQRLEDQRPLRQPSSNRMNVKLQHSHSIRKNNYEESDHAAHQLGGEIEKINEHGDSLQLNRSFIGDRSMEILNTGMPVPDRNANERRQDGVLDLRRQPQEKLGVLEDNSGLSLLDIASPSASIQRSKSKTGVANTMYVNYMEQRILQLERNIEMLNSSLHAQSSVVDETEHVLLELRGDVSKKRSNSTSDRGSDGIAKDANNMSLDRIDSLLGRVKAAQREAGRAILECANSGMKK